MDRHRIRTADKSCRAEQPKMSQNLIAAFVFELLNVKVEKIRKNNIKRARTPRSVHGSSQKLHSK